MSGPPLFREERPRDLPPAQAALVDALRDLVERHAQPLDELGEAVRHRLGQKVPARPGKRLSELGTGRRFPTRPELEAIVGLCTGNSPAQLEHFRGLWGAADRERTALQQAAAGRAAAAAAADRGVERVGDARDWVRLGVHEPITQLADGTDLTGRVRDGHLPGYVLREADRHQLRPALQAAAAGERPAVRLVVITGESSAGKSRMAAEAACAVLADWRLVVGRTPADLAALYTRLGPGPGQEQGQGAGRVLVWLDEVQDLLTQPGGPEALQRVWDLPAGPVVLLATVRSDAERALQGSPGWRLLDRADTRIELHRRPRDPDELRRELDRAAALDDLWIRDALAHLDGRYGIAEWLAAGPQLLRELGRARTSSDPTARVAAAVVDAAIDCYRAGCTTPVPEPLLAQAHRLYLTAADQADPALDDPALLTTALGWARRRVAGAVGLLVHHRARGDRAFDYLIGHADQPDAPPVHYGLWPVLLRHITPQTSAKIARAAVRHGRDEVAREIVRRNPDDEEILAAAQDEAELARRADTGSEYAAELLTKLLSARGDETALARRADGGDQVAAWRLAELLAERGDEAGLGPRAATGDSAAAWWLISLLAKRGDDAALARRADTGDQLAALRLAELLAERGDDVALARRANTGDQNAIDKLVELLFKRGDEAALARRADTGDREAAWRLAELLAERGNEAALARRADTGDRDAEWWLAELLAERGDDAALARRADTGDYYAAEELAGLLARRGDEAGLACRADAGDQHAAGRLAWLLAERGDEAALARRADTGDYRAAQALAELLAARGNQAS